MKKEIILVTFILSLISLISTASAVEIQLSKEIYSPGETLQAEIYGNFLDSLAVENIHFYRERNIPVEYDILKIKDKYLLYALLPKKSGNYTLKIKDIRYEEDGLVSESDIVKEFSIESTNKTSLSFNPGFIVAREDFYIKIKANKNIEIEVEFLNEKQTISLVKGKEEKIHFSTSNVKNYTETSLRLQGYEIPVFIFPEKSEGIEETAKFRFNPLEIKVILLKEETYSFKVSLINFGGKNLTNIQLETNISDYLKTNINPDFIPVLEPKDRKFINLTFFPKKEGEFSGSVFAITKNLSTELNINIDVTEDKTEITYNTSENVGYMEEETCEELGGKFCKVDEKCTTEQKLTIEGYCCMGECKKEKSSNWVWGVIVIVAMVVGLILFTLYIKKRKKPIDILKQREKKYQERMSTGGEVQGQLSKT